MMLKRQVGFRDPVVTEQVQGMGQQSRELNPRARIAAGGSRCLHEQCARRAGVGSLRRGREAKPWRP